MISVGSLRGPLSTFNVRSPFSEKTYQQIDGLDARSLQIPILADFFRIMIGANPLREAVASIRVFATSLIAFCDIDSSCDVRGLLRQFNIAHNSVQLIMKVELNDQIGLLDILLNRKQDGCI